MKVNEVITEAGIFDKLKSGVAGAVRGFKRSRSTREMLQHPVVQDAIEQWADYVKQVEVGGKDITKQNYESYLNAWLGKWLKLKNSYPGNLTDLSKNGINNYIARAVAQRLSGTMPETEKVKKAKAKQKQAGVKVPDGKRLAVHHPVTKGTYYKTNQAGWTNEMGQKVTSPDSIANLEKLALADPADNVRIEPIPT